MAEEDGEVPKEESLSEGLIQLVATPTGGKKGPGSRSPVFYNPAMVENRDLSIVVLQTLIDTGRIPGTGAIHVLDGLTGSGIRAVRFARELDPGDRNLIITGVDLKTESIVSAEELAFRNRVQVDFHQGDLNTFCGTRRYHYIDIDPYGSPVPFLQSALISSKKNGIVAVTATDTAALTGSVPRVARRRYGISLGRTHFMQEVGCRTLLSYLARLGAAFEIAVKPLLFYSSDHFLRGYVSIEKGAKKADRCLDQVGFLGIKKPFPPTIYSDIGFLGDHSDNNPMGPLWIGKLADGEFCSECLKQLDGENDLTFSSERSLRKMLEIAVMEENFPPGGFDVNETASFFHTSPPSIREISTRIEDEGYSWSRSRFSPTIIKTDAPFRIIEGCFKKAGGS
jgi:tRNA (guanine26-N2/guanine27-N2)-dimethyltransferase